MFPFVPLLASAPLGAFQISPSQGMLTSLRCASDPAGTEFIARGMKLGDVQVWTKNEGGGWKLRQAEDVQSRSPLGRRWKAGGLELTSAFAPEAHALLWRITITNPTSHPIVLGGLGTPLPMRTGMSDRTKPGVLKHSFVSGAGSFVYWQSRNEHTPFLLMTPLAGSAPEFWQATRSSYDLFLLSAAMGPTILAHKGSWRLPHSARTLGPGESLEYGYRFEWADNYQGVRDILARDGKLDVQIAPGMTVPSDLYTDVALRSSLPVTRLEAEHQHETEIRAVGRRQGYSIYQIHFRRLGENRISVVQRGGAKTYLEFFSCQPIETLIKKRAAFLAKSQQRGTGKWYEGLFSEWNMQSQIRLSPDNYDRIKGWRVYEVTCDDPGLGKPAFLASENAEYPLQAQVTALDYYIDKFVWGGLQRTDQEKYAYGVYGIPDWKQNRDSKAKDLTKGIYHLWRCYDYPHIIVMYESMYRIAAQHPEIRTRHSTLTYLERAYGTANAMFTVPDELVKWSAYDTGFYNEVVIQRLIDDLRHEGLMTAAASLQKNWDRKVKTFVAGSVDLFGSEYAFDSTGFESTQAIADYALRHRTELGLSQTDVNNFLQRQMRDNLFCRGVIEPAYYYLGSDYRGSAGNAYTLSYMSQMGGCSVLDYALKEASDPAPYIRLGYQSLLSSWALVNAGTRQSNYGYWYPGPANDGGAGGGFEPSAYGETWLQQPHGRGSWYYSCEEDLGFTGALRGARTIVADDPIFGRFCFGGSGSQHGAIYRFEPRDGVRRRISIRTKGLSADVELTGAHFDRSVPALLDAGRRRLQVVIEPTKAPSASLQARGVQKATIDGKPLPARGGFIRMGPSTRSRRLELFIVPALPAG